MGSSASAAPHSSPCPLREVIMAGAVDSKVATFLLTVTLCISSCQVVPQQGLPSVFKVQVF